VSETNNFQHNTGLEIAVIGMAGRFPGASSVHEFWNNIKNGVNSITYFTKEELKEADINDHLIENPNYVKARGILKDIEYFDAHFFGYTPPEAEVMDPQLRIFHECVWEALEDAAYDPLSYKDFIGVYAGSQGNIYWQAKSMLDQESRIDEMSKGLLDNKDFLTTQVSYKLNLKGPSFSLFTACSTSLVAIHVACRALLSGECDIAIAGGITVRIPQYTGYMYQEGMIFSSDGHIRAFDAQADGFVFGNGVGIVILKPLENAVHDGDNIHAVIKGSAINNDGNRKAGYTASGVKGQAEVIKAAYQFAEVAPASISFIETHGTATSFGDPVEINALLKVFYSAQKGSIAIGSVKTNIGHLDIAAGVTGVIKTVLALKHQLLPPSLYFEAPNPQIDFVNSPFFVNCELMELKNSARPLRAGVSSFGLGGTNAHLILEQAPERNKSSESKQWQLLMFSAKTEIALNKITENFVNFLKTNPHTHLADAAYTLQVGRTVCQFKRMVVCSSVSHAIELLSTPNSHEVRSFNSREEDSPVIFMIAVSGAQHVNMGLELYQKECAFRKEMDTCFALIKKLTHTDIKSVLYPNNEANCSPIQIHGIQIAQLVLFIINYSYAKLLMKWGIKPYAMIGDSLGEYIVACLSGVFSLADALKIIARRGQLIAELPEGEMMSVPLPIETLTSLMNDNLSISIDNGTSCIVAGPRDAIGDFERQMKNNGIISRRVEYVTHALHSKMMEPILKRFEESFCKVTLNKPKIPYISCISGNWVDAAEAVNPKYWASHLRKTIQFASGIRELSKQSGAVFIEIGLGSELSTFITSYIKNNPDQHFLNFTEPSPKKYSDLLFLLKGVGQLWLYGVPIDWDEFYFEEKRHRIPLPTYPFQRERFWIEGDPFKIGTELLKKSSLQKKEDIANWFYLPSWKPSILTLNPQEKETGPLVWLVFMDEIGIGEKLVNKLEEGHQEIITIKKGPKFRRDSGRQFYINQEVRSDYLALFDELKRLNLSPHRILHLWNIVANNENKPPDEWLKKCQYLGYYSLIYLAHALENQGRIHEIHIITITSNMQWVYGSDLLYPEKATLLGPVNVIPQEYPHLKCRTVDIFPPEPGSWKMEQLITQLLHEVKSNSTDSIVAYRDFSRLVRDYEPLRLESPSAPPLRLRKNGVYLLTGGLGAIGLLMAKFLAEQTNANLILIGRSPFPARDHWAEWIADHPADDDTSLKIKTLIDIESLGSKVLTLRADVSNQKQMEETIGIAEKKFGPINGVLHTALQIAGGVIHTITPEETEKVFAAKINGTLILDRILKNNPLDFFILFSALSSILARMGQVAYGAASAFLDAFALHKCSIDGVATTSIGWDAWEEIGSAFNLVKKQSKNLGLSDQQSQISGILPTEGVEVFRRIIETPLSYVAVSTRDLLEEVKTYKIPISLKTVNKITSPKKRYKRPYLDSEYIAPRNDLEQSIVNVWENFFGFEPIGVQDDFFELGGDSLKSIVITSSIQQELNIQLPISIFFNSPTIDGIIEYIKKSGSEDSVSNIIPVEEKEYYPLSSAQNRMYFSQEIRKESCVYNEAKFVVLEGEIDIDKIQKTFKNLIKRHESLRTSFELVDCLPVQRIHDSVELEIEQATVNLCSSSDLCGKTTNPYKDIIEDFIRPFELSHAPLLRARLMIIGESRYVLMVDMHHIITDGVSLNIFVNEFSALYGGVELPPLRLQYKDFSEWLNSDSTRIYIAKQQSYWLKQFTGLNSHLNIPTDYPRPKVISFRGNRVNFFIPKELNNRLKELAKETGTTIFMVLLSAYNILLARYSGQKDIVVGTPITGRRYLDLQDIIGMFVNMLALKNQPNNEMTFLKFLESVKQNALQAYENQDYPFETLIVDLNLQGTTQRNPLFDIVLAMLDVETGAESNIETGETVNLTLSNLEFEKNHIPFDLLMTAFESAGEIKMFLDYSTDLFNSKTAEKITFHFIEILNQIVDKKNNKLKEISLTHELSVMNSNDLLDDQSDFGF